MFKFQIDGDGPILEAVAERPGYSMGAAPVVTAAEFIRWSAEFEAYVAAHPETYGDWPTGAGAYVNASGNLVHDRSNYSADVDDADEWAPTVPGGNIYEVSGWVWTRVEEVTITLDKRVVEYLSCLTDADDDPSNAKACGFSEYVWQTARAEITKAAQA